MLESNQPYQRVDNNKSVWEGAAIGAGMGALKVGAIDVPIDLAMNRKLTSKLKDGGMKTFLHNMQDAAQHNMKQPGLVGAINKFGYGGGKMRAARYGLAVASGGLIGGIMANK